LDEAGPGDWRTVWLPGKKTSLAKWAIRREYRRIVRMATRKDGYRFSCQEVRAGGAAVLVPPLFAAFQRLVGWTAPSGLNRSTNSL
jgi:hypothetical protein